MTAAASILVHADWSVSPGKRWVAHARVGEEGWTIEVVEPVGDCRAFVRSLVAASQQKAVLAGFDFPIGVPETYGKRTALRSFPDLLQQIGQGRWARFGDIAREPGDIGLERPFYPAGASAGLKQADLLAAHGVTTLDELRRQCERQTGDRRAACPLFWTLGGNQVGRAALAGWTEVVKPALTAGARLWPFDGSLISLSERPGLVLAETYPAEAYGHVGVVFRSSESKTRQEDRASKADAIFEWASQHGVHLSDSVAAMISDGFGADKAGEDRFDALLGLCGMIEVASGRRSEGKHPSGSAWEGWILGQAEVGAPIAPTPSAIRGRATLEAEPWMHAARAAFDHALIQNSYRAMVAEAIVDLSLPVGWRWCAQDWSSWDFEHEDGTRIEVKHSAAQQSWEANPERRRRSFDIETRTGRWEASQWIEEIGRAADIYIFAFHPIVGDAADHRLADQWEFYVVPTSELPPTKSISLDRVRALAETIGHGGLAQQVESLRDAHSIRGRSSETK